jgi:hypothetical protein
MMFPISPYIQELIKENGINVPIATQPIHIPLLVVSIAMNTVNQRWMASMTIQTATPIEVYPVIPVIRKEINPENLITIPPASH